jgi:hypothetical protein
MKQTHSTMLFPPLHTANVHELLQVIFSEETSTETQGRSVNIKVFLVRKKEISPNYGPHQRKKL